MENKPKRTYNRVMDKLTPEQQAERTERNKRQREALLAKDPDYFKRYREEHKEQDAEYKKTSNKKHNEKRKKYKNEWYNKRSEELKKLREKVALMEQIISK